MDRKAIVLDNKDPDEKSRVKLRILPELKDVSESELPWVSPNKSTRDIPEIDDIVYVSVDNEFNIRNMRYSNTISVLNNIDYDKVKDDVEAIADIVSNYQYPQPNEFQKFKDGSYVFRNTETGELVFCHNSGVYTIYDEDGNVTTYTKDKYFKVYNDKLTMQLEDNGDYLFENEKVSLSMKNNGDVNYTNDGVTLDLKNSGDTVLYNGTDFAVRYNELETAFNTFKDDMNSFINEKYNTHTHPATTTATIGPTGVVGVVTTTPTPTVGIQTMANILPAKIDKIKLPAIGE